MIRAALISLVEQCYYRDDSPDQGDIDELRGLFYLRVEWEMEGIVVRMRTRHLRGLRTGQHVQTKQTKVPILCSIFPHKEPRSAGRLVAL
jgi:hypothetical protein